MVWARALYDYAPQGASDFALTILKRFAEADELELRKGELILVVDQQLDEDWWHGEVGSRRGEFPSNYVQVVEDGDEEPSPRPLEAAPPEGDKAPAPPDGAIASRPSPASNGRRVVEQSSLREMRLALAAAEAEQAALAEETKALKERRVDEPSADDEEAEDEDHGTATEGRLLEATRRHEEADARRRVSFQAAESKCEVLELRRRELEEAVDRAEARRRDADEAAEKAAEKARIMREQEESRRAGLDEEAIWRIIEKRVKAELEERDAVIRGLRDTVHRLRDELLGAQKRHAEPPRSSRSEADVIHKTLHSPLKLPVVDQAKPRRRRARKPVEQPSFDDNLPRVATLRAAGADRAKHAQEAQVLRDLAAKAAVRYARCKSVVFAPDDPPEAGSCEAPETTLALEHAYAYSGESRRKVFVGCNAVWSTDARRAVYPAAGLVVAHELVENRQGFFDGHADSGEAVTAVARHPTKDVFATGQTGKRPKACVWVLGQGGEVSPVADLRLPLGSRFVSLLRFSPCGHLLLTLGADEGHTLTLWAWQRAAPLLTHRAGVQPVYGFEFHPALVAVSGDESFDFSGPGEAHYALASCGYRCFKFWTLALESDPHSARATAKSPPPPKKWRCEGCPATAGKAHGELQNVTFTALAPVLVESALDAPQSPRSADESTFVPDACYVAGTDRGALAVWQQTEDEDEEVRWLPRGRCLASVRGAHEGAVLALAVGRGRGALRPPRVASAGRDGKIKIHLISVAQKRCVELVAEIVVAAHAPVLGSPRSLCLDDAGDKLLVGTQGNALAVVELPPLRDAPSPSEDLKAAFVECARRAAEAHSGLAFHIVAHGHAGRVEQAAAHPTLQLVATVGADKTLRFWDTAERRLAQLLRLPHRALALAFDPSGEALALGCDNGDVFLADRDDQYLWRLKHKRRVAAPRRPDASTPRQHQLKQGSVDELDDPPHKLDDDDSLARQQNNVAVLAVAFSPDGTKLAAACTDKCIHVFCDNYRKRCAVLKGHTSPPVKLDFDDHSTVLQSNDLGRELFFWDLQAGKQLTNAYALRNTKWATWTCTVGWAVHGAEANEDFRAVARSTKADVLLAPGHRNAVRLTRYPTLPGAAAKTFVGHSKQISALAFAHADDKAFSAGGSDAALLQWAHLR